MSTYENIRYDYALPSGYGGSLVLIKTLTASSDSTLSFVDGSSDVVLDNTYRTYIFKFSSIHPATDTAKLQVGFRDGSTDYDATKTTSTFATQHNEADDSTDLSYQSGNDIAQGTGFQDLTRNTGNGNDESTSGELYLFNPSSTTYVKHFIARTNSYFGNDQTENLYIAGYCNVTAAIDAVQFKMSSGNIDAGVIKLYGIA
tara:strand:+ start:1029 stop:1631 length:603 start_codon:yes stop_codon:yes gene_type:complete